MSFEKYTQLYYEPSGGVTLRPMKGGKKFTVPPQDADGKCYRLFVAGEVGLFYQWKNEPDHPMVYRSISDSLSAGEAELSAFALSLSSKRPEEFIRRAYKKVLFAPRLSYLDMTPVPESFTAGFRAKAHGLVIEEDGYLRMRICIRHLKNGVSRHSTLDPADEVHIIDIPEGDYGYTAFERKLYLKRDGIASVGIFFEGKGYSGEVYIEEPHLSGGGHNLLPGFAPSVQGKEHFDWTGQYLSRKEWPEFRVRLGGKVVFEGEVFERCHRDSEWEAELPSELMSSGGELEIELISDYHDALPYTIHELGIIECRRADFTIVAVSPIAAAGGEAHALIRTDRDGMRISASYSDGLFGKEEHLLEKAGLHGIRMMTDGTPREGLSFTLTSEKHTERASVGRTVIKGEDNVYTGTGDIIYVHQDEISMENFLCWYVAEGIGNLLTIRPTYRWSGSRTVNSTAWQELARVMNELGMKYPHMLDGRELEGLNANPDASSLDGEGFLGRQLHERDGAMFYWQRYKKNMSLCAEQYDDMAIEICREDPEHSNPIHNGQSTIYVVPKRKKSAEGGSVAPTFEGDVIDDERIYLHKDQSIKKDMKVGHDYTVDMLRHIKAADVTRHTGPSVTFKYFLEAGYSWVGAETMYGTLEELMTFLRGAVAASGISDMGVHHALQWSSSPQDAPEHVRRYRLALYVSYMQGATEINTEEGLWRLEEYYSRFNRHSDACLAHTKAQQDFYKYVQSHTRRGKFYTPTALIHGRYDGFNGFCRNAPWGYKGIKDTDAERSWDLLSVIYPEGTLGDPTYFHNCPTDREVGFNSSVPLGNVDAIPIETSGSIYKSYRAIAFMGYNYAEERDFQELYSYVADGGRLLLTLAHMTSTTDYESIFDGRLEYHGESFMPTEGEPALVTDTVGGKEILIPENLKAADAVTARTDSGRPLVCRYKIGKGEVTLIAASAFPAHPAIRDIYERELLSHIKRAADKERVFVESTDKVGTAIYRREDGSSDVYLIAVDWYRPEDAKRTAILRIGDRRYTVSMQFGVMIKCCVHDDFAAYAHSEDGEVISIDERGIATVQGIGCVRFTLISSGASRTVDVDFGGSGLQTIEI